MEAGDRPAAANVVRVARRRFPVDFWVCTMQGGLELNGAPNADPAASAKTYAAALALRPQSAIAHVNLALALQDCGKADEVDDSPPRGHPTEAG